MSILKVDELQSRTSGNRITLPDVNNYPPYRNIIINGDMSIAQRGTSATGLGNADNGYHTVDRFQFFEIDTPTYEFTMTQDSDVPTGQGFAKSMKLACTTAQASLGTDNALRFLTILEGQMLQHLKFGTSNAESLTLSFWVKSNKTGDYSVALYNSDSVDIITQTITINSANTWEKKTLTFSGDTNNAFNNDNGASLYIWITLLAGTNYNTSSAVNWTSFSNGRLAYGQTVNLADSTSNYINITGVQLEVGDSATPFEHLPYDVNLDRCMRYCQIIGDTTDANVPYAVGMANSTTNFRGVYSFKKEMRASPSTTVSSVSHFRIFENGTANVPTTVTFDQASKRSCQINVNTSGLVQGEACIFRKNTNEDNAKVTLDAEL